VGLIDHLKGDSLSLLSDLPPREVAERLDAGLESMWTPFAIGIVGWVALGRFALRYRHSRWIRRDWSPVLSGRIRPHGAGSRITVRYGLPRLLLIFPAILGFILLSAILSAPLGQVNFLVPLIPIGFGLGVLALLSFESITLESEGDLGAMLAVVEQAAGRDD
jgi:hypothetical protein